MENERVEIEVGKNFIKNKSLTTIPVTLPVRTQKIPSGCRKGSPLVWTVRNYFTLFTTTS